MDSKKPEPEDSTGNEGHVQPEAPVIETVARGIGTAIGVVASTAAKVIGKSEPPEPEVKHKEKPRKASTKTRAASNDASNKHATSRMAKKKKKRAAHRVKLKRSNTKG